MALFVVCYLTLKFDELKMSRLRLAHLTGKTIKQGLKLLGIEVVDRL
jgi:arginyl-tRNA synthetase